MTAPSAKPLRVLFVIPGEAEGNSMIFARRQADSLKGEGVDVECFSLRSRTSPLLLLREYFRLRRHVARFQPALVHAQFGTVTAMLAACVARRMPLAITYRGGDLNDSPSTGAVRSHFGRLLSQLAASRAQLIVCVSEGLRRRLWWARDRAIVLPSGVDTEQFRPEARDSARQRLGWSLRDRVVLFNAGRDPKNKRLDLAVKAVGMAQRAWPDLRLEVLNGQLEPEQVPTWLNASDCLLMTSDTEGSPTMIQEALACAVPIVSVDVGDAVERLRGVRHARIIERDAERIGQALAHITATPLRTNGPELVFELSLIHTTQKLCGLYRAALGERPLAAAALRGH